MDAHLTHSHTQAMAQWIFYLWKKIGSNSTTSPFQLLMATIQSQGVDLFFFINYRMSPPPQRNLEPNKNSAPASTLKPCCDELECWCRWLCRVATPRSQGQTFLDIPCIFLVWSYSGRCTIHICAASVLCCLATKFPSHLVLARSIKLWYLHNYFFWCHVAYSLDTKRQCCELGLNSNSDLSESRQQREERL